MSALAAGCGRGRGSNRFGHIQINVDALVPPLEEDETSTTRALKRKIAVITIPTAPVQPGLIFNEAEDDSLYTEDQVPDFAYENLTLEEIIRLNRCRADTLIIPNMGKKPEPKKDQLVLHEPIFDENELQLTPITVLRILSENRKLIEMEAKELTNLKGPNFRERRWRVIWTHEGIQGFGEGPRKLLASQAGALDLIEKLRLKFPEYNLPKCAIPRGCRISPYVFALLEEKCKQMCYADATFQLKLRTTEQGKKVFQSICYVEDEVFVGQSSDPNYAKRFAGKAAYEAILHGEFPDDDIVRGDKCGDDDEYSKVISEANHVYNLYELPKRPRITVTITNGRGRGMPAIGSAFERSLNGSGDENKTFGRGRGGFKQASVGPSRSGPGLLNFHVQCGERQSSVASSSEDDMAIGNNGYESKRSVQNWLTGITRQVENSEAMMEPVFIQEHVPMDFDMDFDALEIEEPEKYEDLSDSDSEIIYLN